MNLDRFYLPQYANISTSECGIDSLEECKDKKLFINFPYKVDYNYNSKGYRDTEWPADPCNSIICIGDSFTVGLGSPYAHAWPTVLENEIKIPTINISMNGASNEWIAEQAINVMNIINPEVIVIMWSYTHRRQLPYTQGLEKYWHGLYDTVKDCSWPQCSSIFDFNNLPTNIKKEIIKDFNFELQVYDEDYNILDYYSSVSQFYEHRIMHTSNNLGHEDVENFITCLKLVSNISYNTKIINLAIPEFCPLSEKNLYKNSLHRWNIDVHEIKRLDLARDGHHFDIKTSKNIAKYVANKLIGL